MQHWLLGFMGIGEKTTKMQCDDLKAFVKCINNSVLFESESNHDEECNKVMAG